MNRTRRMELLGMLVMVAVVDAAFAVLCAVDLAGRPPLEDFERWGVVQGWMLIAAPWTVATPLLWRAWWRLAGAEMSTLDGPARLLATATATLPADRHDWGQAMTVELAQVRGRSQRWRFALGGARTAIFPPGGSRRAVTVAGAAAAAAVALTALATGAVPATRVFALTFVTLMGGLVVLVVARSRRDGRRGAGPGVVGLGLAGVAGCVAAAVYYLVNYPSVRVGHPPGRTASLTPVTAVVFAVALAVCVWLAVAPPRWLLAFRAARWFGAGVAVFLAAGLVLASRASVRAYGLDGGTSFDGVLGYLFIVPSLVFLVVSVVAAAVGRSFRAGLAACAWAFVLGAPLVVVAYLTEGLYVYQHVGWAILDGAGFAGDGPGLNLADAVWWTVGNLLLGPLPLGVIGAAAGSARARRRRARRHTEVVPGA